MKKIYDKLPQKLKKEFSKIKFLVMDFDGVFTDNKVYTDQKGRETVMSDRGDGLILDLFREHSDVRLLILTKEPNPVNLARAKKLKIPCVNRVDNKNEYFKKEISKRKLSNKEVCFMGNDLNDIGCIKEAGIGVAVVDSYPQALKVSDYITKHKGGHGAIREICEFIMYAKKMHPYP